MSSTNALLSLAVSTRSPFIVQKCIRQMVLESEKACAQYRLISPEIDRYIKDIWRSHDTLYGLCDYHVDNLYSEELNKSMWWTRRKLKKIEQQWKTGMWLTLSIEAETFISKYGD